MQILKLTTFPSQNWQNLWAFPCTLNENLTFCWDFDWWYSRRQILRIQKIVRHTPQGKGFQIEETLSPSQLDLCLHTSPLHTYTQYINRVIHPSSRTIHSFDISNLSKEGGVSYLKTIESVTKTIQCGVYIEAQICKILQSIEA